MPEQAIAAGDIHHILPIKEMAGALDGADAESEHTADQPADGQPNEAGEGAQVALRDAILALIKSRHGRDFFHYKRGTITRRIDRRMERTGAADLYGYLEKLRASHDESKSLLSDLRIGVTRFFRDAAAFQALEDDVIPKIIETPATDGPPLRIWVPGCASGEKAYSLAMAFGEALQAIDSPRKLQIFATDIDEPALTMARAGRYSEQAIEDIPRKRRTRWFERVDGGYRVTRDLRSRVIFAVQSVGSDPPFSRLVLISCRNVLIYLDKPAQRQIAAMFHFALRPHGYLFLGSSENVDSEAPLFCALRPGVQIFRARLHSNPSHSRIGLIPDELNSMTPISQRSAADP